MAAEKREQEEQEAARADEENEAVGNGRTEEQETLHMELGGGVITCADRSAKKDAGTETLESRLRRFVWFSAAHTEDLWERGKESATAVEALVKLSSEQQELLEKWAKRNRLVTALKNWRKAALEVLRDKTRADRSQEDRERRLSVALGLGTWQKEVARARKRADAAERAREAAEAAKDAPAPTNPFPVFSYTPNGFGRTRAEAEQHQRDMDQRLIDRLAMVKLRTTALYGWLAMETTYVARAKAELIKEGADAEGYEIHRRVYELAKADVREKKKNGKELREDTRAEGDDDSHRCKALRQDKVPMRRSQCYFCSGCDEDGDAGCDADFDNWQVGRRRRQKGWARAEGATAELKGAATRRAAGRRGRGGRRQKAGEQKERRRWTLSALPTATARATAPAGVEVVVVGVGEWWCWHQCRRRRRRGLLQRVRRRRRSPKRSCPPVS